MTHQSARCQEGGAVSGRKRPLQDGESTKADLCPGTAAIAEVTGTRSVALISPRGRRRRVAAAAAATNQTGVRSWRQP